MQCGHVANGWHGTEPVCAICFPDPKAGLATVVDLTGRMAQCPYCHHQQESSLELAFFQHRPEQETDSFYCGCRGFD